MRLPRTLAFSLLREITAYALLGFALFTLIVVASNLLRRLEDLVAVGVAWGDVTAISNCLFAMFTPYAVPFAFLFGVLLTMARISADSELTAMRACGLGLASNVVPVAVVGALLSGTTAYLLMELEPWGKRELRNVSTEIASRGGLLEPGKFKGLGQRVVYVRDRDRDNRLLGVMISDRSNVEHPFTVFAEMGRFSYQRDQGVMELALERGDIHFDSVDDVPDRYRRVSFDTFAYRFDLASLLGAELRLTRPGEMTLGELRAVIARAEAGESLDDLRERDPTVYRTHYHRRLALPVTPFLFALVGVPLGIRRTRGARSWGFFVCLGVVFAYYTLLVAGETLAQSQSIPVPLGLWFPNLAFGALAVFLLRRARRVEL